MYPLQLLTQREAVLLARDAASDFPGLEILLRPTIVPRPLCDDLTITGWTLIVAGPRCRTPWFTCSSALGYEHMYDEIFAHYEAALALTNAPVTGDEEDEPEPVEDAPIPAFLPERRARRQAKAT